MQEMTFAEMQELTDHELARYVEDSLFVAAHVNLARIPYHEAQAVLMALETLRYRVLRAAESYPAPKEVS
jgi:hypothetical protein